MVRGLFRNIWNFNNRKLISYVVLVISLLIAGYFVKDQKSTLGKIFEIDIYQFLVISCIVVLTPFIDGLRTLLLTKQFGVNLGIGESAALASVNNFWNYLPLTGGLVIRSLYLKKKHGFSYSNFISTLAASYIISFLSFGLVGLISVLVFWNMTGIVNMTIILILLSTVLFSLFLIKINYSVKSNNKFLSVIATILEEWKTLRKKRNLIIKLILLDLALILVFSVRLFLAAQFLGTPLPFLSILIIVSLSLFSVLLNVTPGALVVKEAIISFSAAALSFSFYDSLTVSLLDRAISMVWIFLMGIIFSFYLSKSFPVNRVSES